MNISAEEKNRYLREAEVVLAREGFLTDRIRTGGLRVLLDGLPLCEVPESGGVTYRMADISTPERITAKDKVYSMQPKLLLFCDWGITFGEPYATPEHAVRKVAYASREELFQSVRKAQQEQNTPTTQEKQSEKSDTRKSPQPAMKLYDDGGEQ